MSNPRSRVFEAPTVILVSVAVTLSAIAGFAWFKIASRAAPASTCDKASGQLRIRIAASVPPERDAAQAWAEIDELVSEVRSSCDADLASALIDGEYQDWADSRTRPSSPGSGTEPVPSDASTTVP